MFAAQPTAETLPLLSGRTALVGLTIAVLTIAYYGIEHRNTQVSTLEAFTVTGDEMAEKAAEGDLTRRIAIPAIGLFGVLLLLGRGGGRLGWHSRLGWLLLAYVVWCGLSAVWSDDPLLTLRRFGATLCCGIGALGIARQVSLRDLCLIAMVVSTIFVVNDVCTEIVLGTFRPFSPEYRFAGTLHPNSQAQDCATMALAAFFLASGAKRGRMFLWLMCVTGVVLLLLTKSRTTCAALLAGLLVYGSFAVSWRKKVLIGTAILSFACAVALAVSLLGYDFGREVVNVALIGRQEQAESLTGRFPLWADLLPYAQDRFLLGHGYLTFWSPQRIESFSRSYEWTVPSGHNAYLDAVLDLGVVGVALGVATVLAGIGVARRCFPAGGDFGYGFVFALLIARGLNAFLESPIAVPTSFPPFIMVCGLVHLAFCPEREHFPLAEESTWEVGR